MRVHVNDGSCRGCGGELEIVDVANGTMTVFCSECGDSYPVEPEGLGPVCLGFYLRAKREQGEVV
jgi:hypothetical protein